MPIALSEVFKAARQNDVPTLMEALTCYDVNTQDEQGKTFLHHAFLALAEDAVSFLLDVEGVDTEIEDDQGIAPGINLTDVWSNNTAAERLAAKLADCWVPFPAEEMPDDWPRNARTGRPMSKTECRKFLPGFLETYDLAGRESHTGEPKVRLVYSRPGDQNGPGSGPK